MHECMHLCIINEEYDVTKAALKNTTDEHERIDFAVWVAQFQAFARAKTPVGAKNACLAGQI